MLSGLWVIGGSQKVQAVVKVGLNPNAQRFEVMNLEKTYGLLRTTWKNSWEMENK